ncbi:hypothetical protein [Edwardsiella piscicida]|uniref:hypothetical protein n=1 Tax=Edwardsiella piscicida TaxID=1263550 RepID=UPI00370D7169
MEVITMNRFKKVGVAWFLFLIFYCSFLISFILLLYIFGISIVLYFIDGEFSFEWEDPLRKGIIAGLTLGVGIWIKHKLYEYKNKK